MYVVLVANCDPQTDTIIISGHSEWKNPYGERTLQHAAWQDHCCSLFPVGGVYAL